MKRHNKKIERRFRTSIKSNNSIIGDSPEVMMEKIANGEGVEGIPERDLVYNDNEVKTVNPITNIRSDVSELRLEEKIGQYDWEHRDLSVKKDEPNADNDAGGEE